MAINRTTIRRVEREAQAETMVLVCGECGEELRVAEDTDLHYIAWCWTQETGAKSYQRTPADVFVIVNHPHDAEKLINRRIGEPWLERLSNAGGHYGA